MNVAQYTGDIFKDRRFLILSVVLLFVISSILFYLAKEPPLNIVVFFLILAIPLIFLILKQPKVWLWTIALSSFLFFRASDLGVSVMDVVFGGYYIGSIFLWLFWMVLIKKEKIVYSFADWLILFFYIAMIFSVIISLLNGVIFLEWFREFVLFSNLLLYFPLKHYLKEKKDLKIFLLLFTVSIIISSIDQLRSYKEVAISQSVYAYQLGTSVRLNQTLFSAAIFFSLFLSLHKMKLIYRVFAWSITALSIATLIVSFSRSFWLFVIAGLFLVLFFLRKEQRRTMIIGMTLIAVSGIIIFFNVFQDKVQLITTIIENRLTSATQGKKDASVYLRLVEYDKVFEHIKANPFFGNGLGKKFVFYDPNLHMTQRPKNIHSGYFFLAYRFGIPMALIFLTIIGLILAKGLKQSIIQKDDYWRLLSLASSFSIMMMIVACFASNQFFGRDGEVVLAVSFAIISMAKEKSDKLTT